MSAENASLVVPPGRPLAIGGRRGGLWIGAAAVASALCSLVAQIGFERALGIDGFARWAYLLSLLGLLVPIACMGANHLVLSEFFHGRLSNRTDATRLIAYFGAFSVAALVVVLELHRRAPVADDANLPFWLLAVLFLSQVPINLAFPVFQGRGRARWVALWPLLQVALRAILAGLAILGAWTYLGAVQAWTMTSVVLALVAVRQVWPSLRARLQRERQETDRRAPGQVRSTVAAGLGFGLGDLLDALDLKLLVPIAAFLYGTTETAAAGLCVVALSAIFFFPHVLITRILLPAIHRSTSSEERTEVRLLVLRVCAWSFVALVPLTALAYVYGYEVIAASVRGDYSSQAMALSLLAFCFAPLCISQLAAAPHMERARTWWLLRRRLEALAVFIGIALGWRSLGLSSLLLAFAAGRLWLSVRVLAGLRVPAPTSR